MTAPSPHISIAPMMDWTDRHFRHFMRLISPHAYLYTEMITTGALINGERERFLRYDDTQPPLALQLGGSDAAAMADCAKMAEDKGYNEVNINCGCPSDRVQNGFFGACLMSDPARVAACVSAMKAAVKIPVTVKCRIGIDEHDSYEFTNDFVSTIADAGCDTFIIHARKAWLSGLSPKENRTVPPINYERVYAIKNAHPHLNIIMNGEIKTLEDIKGHLERCDGAMIGREAYQNPYLFAEIERKIFGNHNIKGRTKIAHAMIPYMEREHKDYGTPIKSITRHLMGLFHHQPGAKSWRRALSTLPYEDGASAKGVITGALSAMISS